MIEMDRLDTEGNAVIHIHSRRGFGFTEGSYTIQDAALYLRATTPPDDISLSTWTRQHQPAFARPSAQSLASWIREGLGIDPIEVASRRRAVTFHDLIRMRMVSLLRTRGLSLSRILEAEQFAREVTHSPNPFVTEPIWTFSSDAFLLFREQHLAISRKGQYALSFLSDYLNPVHHGMWFDDEGVAESWYPSPSVVIQPGVEFGAPCIENTRIQTEVIWSLYQAGDSPDFIANSYGIEVKEVRAAITWEERLADAA